MTSRAPRWLVALGVASACSASAVSVALLLTAGCGIKGGQESNAETTLLACQHISTGCSEDIVTVEDTSTCTAALDGPCANAANLYKSCVSGKCSDGGLADLGAINASCYAASTSFTTCLEAAETDGGVVAARPIVVVMPIRDANAVD